MTTKQPLLIPGCEEPRPTLRDAEILRIAAAKLAIEVHDWAADETNTLQETQEHVLRALVYGTSLDGYNLAKHLEDRHGYVPDAALVEILDDAYHEVSCAVETAVKTWVIKNEIKTTLKVGQAVIWQDAWGHKFPGTIRELTLSTANAIIHSVEYGHSPTMRGGLIVGYERISPKEDTTAPQNPEGAERDQQARNDLGSTTR